MRCGFQSKSQIELDMNLSDDDDDVGDDNALYETKALYSAFVFGFRSFPRSQNVCINVTKAQNELILASSAK